MTAPTRPLAESTNDFTLLPKIAFISLFPAYLVASFGTGTTWPAAVLEGWYVALFGALIGLILCFVAGWRARTPADRALVSLATVGWFCVLFVPLRSYTYVYADHPWSLMIGCLVFTFAGCLISRQVVALIAIAAAVGVWFYGPLQKPRLLLPAVATSGDATFTVKRVVRPPSNGRIRTSYLEGELTLRNPSSYDVKSADAVADAGPFMPINAWTPRRRGDLETTGYSSELGLILFVPLIAQSFDLTIVVPTWKGEPAGSVIIPIPPRGQRDVPPPIEGKRLQVHDLKWIPGDDRISFELHAEPGLLQMKRLDGLLCFDDQGRLLQHFKTSHLERESGAVLTLDVFVTPETKFITVKAASVEQLQEGYARFVFRSLPAPVDIAEN